MSTLISLPNGVQVVDPAPTQAGGVALNANFEKLDDAIGELDTKADKIEGATPGHVVVIGAGNTIATSGISLASKANASTVTALQTTVADLTTATAAALVLKAAQTALDALATVVSTKAAQTALDALQGELDALETTVAGKANTSHVHAGEAITTGTIANARLSAGVQTAAGAVAAATAAATPGTLVLRGSGVATNFQGLTAEDIHGTGLFLTGDDGIHAVGDSHAITGDLTLTGDLAVSGGTVTAPTFVGGNGTIIAHADTANYFKGETYFAPVGGSTSVGINPALGTINAAYAVVNDLYIGSGQHALGREDAGTIFTYGGLRVGGTLSIGSDVSLYRAAANTLKTDDTFYASSLFATGNDTWINFAGDNNNYLSNTTFFRTSAGGSKLWIGGNNGIIIWEGDTNLFRSAANTLRTDDHFHASSLNTANYVHVDGGGSDSYGAGVHVAIGDISGGAHLQYSSDRHLDLWQYNGSTWARTLRFNKAGVVETAAIQSLTNDLTLGAKRDVIVILDSDSADGGNFTVKGGGGTTHFSIDQSGTISFGDHSISTGGAYYSGTANYANSASSASFANSADYASYAGNCSFADTASHAYSADYANYVSSATANSEFGAFNIDAASYSVGGTPGTTGSFEIPGGPSISVVNGIVVSMSSGG